MQKAQVVALVKSRGHSTLGIGDGGNDVSMIQVSLTTTKSVPFLSFHSFFLFISCFNE